MSIAAGAPEVVRADEVLVAPYVSDRAGGPDPERAPIHARMRVGPGRRVIDSFPQALRVADAPRLAGSYLYGGPYRRHFGHVMTESVARLWAYDPRVHDGVVFANTSRNPLTAPATYMRQALSAMGVKRDRIRILEAPTVVETLWFAEPGALPAAPPEAWYWGHLAKVETLLLARADPDLPTFEKLFVGRMHIRRGAGSFMGESWFAEAARENGFVAVQPETLSLPDQVKRLRSARAAIYTEGSAAHITELMTPFPARVGMILRRGGGEVMFAPQLTPRCEFHVAGLDSDIRRLTLTSGLRGPSAPSYHLRPERTHADLVRFGFIRPGPFDLQAYRSAERADALDYHWRDVAVAEAQLAEIEGLRRACA